jgi:hypothetical protein
MLEWHTAQNKQQRSGPGTHDWLVGQVNGGYIRHLENFLSVLTTPNSLMEGGFAMQPMQIHGLQDDLKSEEMFADYLGQSCIGIVAFRLRRNLTLISGWPKQFMRLMRPGANDAQMQAVVDRFLSDRDAFKFVNEQANFGPRVKAVCARSLFHKTSVVQMDECLKRTGGLATHRVRAVVADHTTGLLQTQVIEDIIGHQKNNKQTQALQRYRRPVASMTAALGAHVLDERHKFETCSADYALKSKATRLKASHFLANREQQSLEFHRIASHASSTTWWSPAPENNSAPTSDLWLFRDYMEHKNDGVFELAELGMVGNWTHQVVLQHTSNSGSDEWFAPLIHFYKSSVAVWPVLRRALVPGDPESPVSFEFCRNLEEPRFICIYDLSKWNACSTVWHSWAWQAISLGVLAATVAPAVRLFQSGKQEPIFNIACRRAFWNLSKTSIETLAATVQDCKFDKSNSLCGVLEEIVQSTLRYARDHEEMLHIVCSSPRSLPLSLGSRFHDIPNPCCEGQVAARKL